MRLDELSDEAETEDEDAIEAVGEGVALFTQLVGELDESLTTDDVVVKGPIEDGDDLIDAELLDAGKSFDKV